MPIWQRVLIVPGVIAVFWPSLYVEAAGTALILFVLFLNRQSDAGTGQGVGAKA